MYCPKCKETFEEGSRRFCPTDGSRLVPENAAGAQWEGGIFASVMPKRDSQHGREEILQDLPKFIVTEPPSSQPALSPEIQQADDTGDFFILEDIEPDHVDPILTDPPPLERPERDVRPPVRKIDPFQIPAGHVELDEGDDRLAFSSADFRAEDPEAFIGRTVKGRYVVTGYFGGDESGYAFLADDKIMSDRKVLVRILLRGDANEIMGSILEEERVSLSHFTHPNIARLIDSGQFTDGTRFLVSEYVDALSVAEILNIHGAFDPQRAGRVIKQAAYALSEAHQEGILHRDLRPGNIIVSPADGDGDHVTLVNFGASSGEPTEQSLPYRAPEVLDGRVSTTASDVFSLAVVAYEMLTGKLPFRGDSANELLRSQNEGRLDPPSGLRRGLPSLVDAVLARGLSFKVADRYPGPRDLGDALYAVLIDAEVDDEVLFTDPLPDEEPQVETKAETHSDKSADEPAWRMRSPEPLKEGTTQGKIVGAIVLAGLVALLVFGWYYVVRHPAEPDLPPNAPTKR